MKYKHFLLIIFLFSICHTNSFAQVNVGSKEIPTQAGNIDPDDLAALKQTKTVFVFTTKDAEQQDNWKKVFQDVWTVTPVEFINYDRYNAYLSKPNYSFFTISGIDETTHMNTGSYKDLHLYLTLWMNKKKKNGKDEKITFCRIELFPESATMTALMYGKKDQAIPYIYKQAKLYNWYPGILKDPLRMTNDVLAKGGTQWLFGNSEVDDELSKIKGQTLYIPDYALVAANMMTGKESTQEADKLMKDYKGDYKILKPQELSDKILSGEQFYYLTYVRSSTDKFINIYDNGDGKNLYSRYKPVSYKMNDGDFKDLNVLIQGKK